MRPETELKLGVRTPAILAPRGAGPVGVTILVPNEETL